MEDLEGASLLRSRPSSVSIPLPGCMPFALSPDQSVIHSAILLLQGWSADITWELVKMQISGPTQTS